MTRSRLFTYENAILLLLGLTFGFLFFDRNAAGFLAPFIAPDLKLSNWQIGFISSGLSITWAISAYVFGAWSDRTGIRKPFLIACVLAFSACSFLSGIASSFALLIVARMLMGLAEGPFLPVALSIMAAESSEGRRGFNMGAMQNGFAALFGTFAAPLLLVPLAERFSWHVSFFVAGVPGLLCALLIARYVREPVAARAEPRSSPADQRAERSPGLVAMLKVRNVWLCSLISCFMVGWMVLGWAFLPTFFVLYRHIPAMQMGYLMSALGVCAAFAGLAIPALSDRIGRRPVVIFFPLLAVLCPLAALYYGGSIVVLGALMFIGWLAAGVFPLFMGTIPAESTSPRLIATAMGLVVGIGEIVGGFCGPLIAGAVADRTSLEAPILIEAGCALAGGLLAIGLKETAPARKKGTDLFS
ncbi:MAG TPA: MFS transporter [Steroidobacteraceae bacterium]|nr:MFS transporter [Steroidobacteraceae bacterium]